MADLPKAAQSTFAELLAGVELWGVPVPTCGLPPS